MLGFLVVVMIMPSGLIQSLPSDILVSIITLLLLIAMYFGIRQGIEREVVISAFLTLILFSLHQ